MVYIFVFCSVIFAINRTRFIVLPAVLFDAVIAYQKNTQIRDFNRNNINDIINRKVSNLPILKNDTSDVIEFNDGFTNEIKHEKSRSFWNLLKSK